MIKLKTTLALAFILAFGFSSFATITVSPTQPITGCVDTFRTTIIGTNYSWNFGPNAYPQTLNGPFYIAAPAAFLTAGNHTVKVTVTTLGGPVVDSLVVNVQASGSNITITPNGPLCAGSSITYTASTGYTEYAFFVNDSLMQLSATNTFSANLFSGDSVRVFGLSGTCFSNSSATQYITTPAPPDLISSVPGDTICGGQSITFTAEPAAYDSFYFYVGGSLQQASTSNTWTANQLYNQNVVHVIVEKNGCKSIYYNTDTVTVLLVTVPTLTYDKKLCYGVSNDTVTINTGIGSNDTYHWSNGATTSSVVLGVGPFSVTVTNPSLSSCGAVFSDTITQDGQISNTNILTLHLCTNPAHGDLQLDGKGGSGPLTYTVFGINTDTTGTFPNLAPGNYTFNITDTFGCSLYPGLGSVTIPNSIAGDSFSVVTDSVTCFGFNNGQIIVLPLNPDDGPFVYSLDGSGFGFNDTFVGVGPGPHSIAVKQFVFGCQYSYNATITGPAQHLLTVSPDTIMTNPGQLDTVTTVTDFPNPVFNWSPVTGLSCTTCSGPVITADTMNMVYTVKVYGSPDSSCYAVDSVVVIVAPPVLPDSFLMPSAFTPNGDGRNDLFGPITSPKNFTVGSIKSLKIYNRWGQLVFNGNSPWDGKFDGKEQPVGTYVYYIEVTYPANTDNGAQTFKKEGSVTLLR